MFRSWHSGDVYVNLHNAATKSLKMYGTACARPDWFGEKSSSVFFLLYYLTALFSSSGV